MSLVTYNKGVPTETGMYACRTDDPHAKGLMKDQFLMWFEGRWWYPSSDQRCSLIVHGWVGPLQRQIVKQDEDEL